MFNIRDSLRLPNVAPAYPWFSDLWLPRFGTTLACPPGLAGRLGSTGAASQLITVDALVPTTTFATVSLWQRAGACWSVAGGPWPARIGASGFSDHHHEGDGTTPTGAYGLGPVMYGNAPDPGVRYLYHDLVCGDWWDGDPGSATYNTFQHVPCLQTPPFAGNSEALWQQPQAYSSFAVVQYYAARVPARAPLSSSTPTRGRQRPAASPCRAVTSIACCAGSVQPAPRSS